MSRAKRRRTLKVCEVSILLESLFIKLKCQPYMERWWPLLREVGT